jgi:6-phosphogluconolactonase (cycloisomerase 2 family)
MYYTHFLLAAERQRELREVASRAAQVGELRSHRRHSRLLPRHSRMRERLKARVWRTRLDRELARGAPPAADPALSMRAQQLGELRSRRDLAKAVWSVIEESRRETRRGLWTTRVHIPRTDIRSATDELGEIAVRLVAPGPVRVLGIARVRLLLIDGVGSPLYSSNAPMGLRDAAAHALEGLGPPLDEPRSRCSSHVDGGGGGAAGCAGNAEARSYLRMQRSRKIGRPGAFRSALSASVAALLIAPAVSTAAPPPLGGLTWLGGGEGCIAYSNSYSTQSGCSQDAALYVPNGIAISPDGKDVYVVENYDGGITHLRRDAGGGLTAVSCINSDGNSGCAKFPPLDNADALALSPDGAQLYVVSRNTSGVLTVLNRNQTTGDLTPNPTTPCFSESALAGCATAPHGITDLYAVAVSSSAVFTASDDDVAGGLTAFSRNPSTGALAFKDCMNRTGADGCTTGDEMNGFEGIAVSSDGRYLYGTSRIGGTVNVLGWDGSHLSQLQCYAEANTGLPGCTEIDGVGAPNSITIAQGPSGVSSVYTADFNNDAITEWLRDPVSGKLSYQGCRSQTGGVGSSPAGICDTDPVLWGVTNLAASPDGQTLYTVSDRSNPVQGAQALNAYHRDLASGNLAPIAGSCLRDTSATSKITGCMNTTVGLVDPFAVAVSADGAWVETTAGGTNPPPLSAAVDTFAAEVAPVCQAASAATTAPARVPVTLTCSSAHGYPLTLSIASGPAHGMLSAISGASVAYTPAVGFSGDDTFTFTASDGRLGSVPAIASVHVAAAPTPPDTDKPAAGISSLSCRRTKKRSVCVVIGTASDSDGIAGVQVGIVNTKTKHPKRSFRSAKLVGSKWTLTLGALRAGSYAVTVNATDHAGNRNTVTRTFKLRA